MPYFPSTLNYLGNFYSELFIARFLSQKVSLLHLLGETVPASLHLFSKSQKEHGIAIIVSTLGIRLLAETLYVHLPSKSSFLR